MLPGESTLLEGVKCQHASWLEVMTPGEGSLESWFVPVGLDIIACLVVPQFGPAVETWSS